MDLFVFCAVLAAAACHAGWNTLLKLRLEAALATTLVATASGMVAVPFAFMAGTPDAAAWPFLAASVVIHVAYFVTLAEAYRSAIWAKSTRSRVGPRHLLTAVARHALVHEILGFYGWCGDILLSCRNLLWPCVAAGPADL